MCPTNPSFHPHLFLLSPLLAFIGLRIILSYPNCSLLSLPHWTVSFRKAFYPYCRGRMVTDRHSWCPNISWLRGFSSHIQSFPHPQKTVVSATSPHLPPKQRNPCFRHWKAACREFDLTNTSSWISPPGFLSGPPQAEQLRVVWGHPMRCRMSKVPGS